MGTLAIPLCSSEQTPLQASHLLLVMMTYIITSIPVTTEVQHVGPGGTPYPQSRWAGTLHLHKFPSRLLSGCMATLITGHTRNSHRD